MKILVFLAAAFALMVNLGCGKSKEEAAEEVVEQAVEAALGDEAGVDLSDEGMTVTSEDEDGTYTWKAGDQAEVPSDFPDDVHVYEGAEVVMSTETPDGFSLALGVDAPVEDVVKSYLEAMSAAGWTKHMETEMDGGHMMVYGKGDRSVNVAIFEEEGMTQIGLTVGR